MTTATPPEFPAGEFIEWGEYSSEERTELTTQLENAPEIIRKAIEGFDDQQLDMKYKNWTVRQIIHHLADSHINAYIRFKWALTEASPLIKSYNETKWSELGDARTLPTNVSLAILEGLHPRWAGLIRTLSDEEMEASYFHPEQMRSVTLREALPQYVWHTQHHTAQIAWLKEQHGW